MSSENKIIIAAAGSGKTTYLVKKALEVANENVLILTYTESNEAEIRKKIFDLNRFIPKNIFVMTWFSFLIRHGIRPFQGVFFEFDVRGLNLVNEPSGIKYRTPNFSVPWKEDCFKEHYFDKMQRVFSDKVSKLVIRCDKKSKGSVFDRISCIFGHIFVDEVQDLAGYDLEIISCLFKSRSQIILVGDPRQVTYVTHLEEKYKKYREGKFLQFFEIERPKIAIEIDKKSLNLSHRNSAAICDVSSKLYPDLQPSAACDCIQCRKPSPLGQGMFIVRPDRHLKYLNEFKPTQLRLDINVATVHGGFPVLNFGQSKGLGFDHVIIHPVKGMKDWLRNNSSPLAPKTRAQFYVAMTRARHSVAILCDCKDDEIIEGFSIYK